MFTKSELDHIKNALSIDDPLTPKIDRILSNLGHNTSLDTSTKDNSEEVYELWRKVKSEIIASTNKDTLIKSKTENGDTQVSERMIISHVAKILNNKGLSYTPAASQQPIDFRQVGGILNIEIKKADNSTIMLNDTLPKKGVFYICFLDCKKTPFITFFEGSSLSQDSNWTDEYLSNIHYLKDTYGRGKNAKQLNGRISCYVRPNFSATLKGVEHDPRFETYHLTD